MPNWIYNHNEDNSARYTLGKEGSSHLICFGINPSTAEPNNLDNTVKSVERIADRHGYKSWIMLNIYPQRSTDPNGLHLNLDKELHEINLSYIKNCLGNAKDIKLLAAWGTLILKRPYLIECLKDIHNISRSLELPWHSIGKLSKDGHPHHPLYLNNQEMLKPFDMISYITLIH